MSHTPVYRTYLLQCPANPGKVEAIAAWVAQWRELATLERDYQIARFRKTGGKQGVTKQGRTGPDPPLDPGRPVFGHDGPADHEPGLCAAQGPS